jgi:hypothetical protein
MRKASQDNGIIVEEGKFIGIALGYDYCAEHEFGIKDLKRICGMPEASKRNMGVANRTITKVPKIIFREEVVVKGTTKLAKGKYAILFTGVEWHTKEQDENHVPHDFTNWKESLNWNAKWNAEHPDTRGDKDNIITAWDGGSFGVAVMGEKEVEWLKELKTAIEEKCLTIAVANLRAKNPFAGSSLCLLITDMIPNALVDAMYMGDKEYFDREDYEKKIGMKKIIEKYGNKNGYNGLHYFMACSPKWINYEDKEAREEQKKKRNTKYDIMYWINYSDDDNNAGWYTVEEIKKWLTGKKKLSEIRKG